MRGCVIGSKIKDDRNQPPAPLLPTFNFECRFGQCKFYFEFPMLHKLGYQVTNLKFVSSSSGISQTKIYILRHSLAHKW